MSQNWDDENLELEEELLEDQEEPTVQNELIKRIAKAKLYESLLSSSFFEDEDVEESTKKEVEKEIKNFIVVKLEELLGLKTNSPAKQVLIESKSRKTKTQAKSSLGLTEEEMMTLKMVAKKITSPQLETKKLISKKKKHSTANELESAPKKEKTKAELELGKSANISRATGQNYAQMNNPDKIPQPSQEVINQLMQAQASRAFSNFSGGNSPESQIIAAAIGLAQQKNRNVKED